MGDVTLTYEALELPGDPGQTIFVYMAEPNSASHEALNLLASWTTTPAQVSISEGDEGARPPRWLGEG